MLGRIYCVIERFSEKVRYLPVITKNTVAIGIHREASVDFPQGVAAVVSMYQYDAAQAVLLSQSIEVMSSALSFANGELLGGLWMLLIGISGLKAINFSEPLNYLCIVIGIVGIVYIIPPLNILSALFGIGQIVWFTWLGIHLLR